MYEDEDGTTSCEEVVMRKKLHLKKLKGCGIDAAMDECFSVLRKHRRTNGDIFLFLGN